MIRGISIEIILRAFLHHDGSFSVLYSWHLDTTEAIAIKMEIPEFPEVTIDDMRMISEKHGLSVNRFSRQPSIGVFNAIYLLAMV
jgi:hypothetical protein